MSQAITSLPDDLAHLQQQLVEFRSTHPVRSRLPATVWAAAVEAATRYGVHRTARVLHLDYVGLKKRVKQQPLPKPKCTVSPATPTFVELVGPAATAPSCRIEVEAAPGTFRLELPTMPATELANLLRAFLGH